MKYPDDFEDPISAEFVQEIKKDCEFNANNCGGCETCAQVFAGKPREYDYQETYSLIQMIEFRDQRIKQLEELLQDTIYKGMGEDL